MPEGYNNRIVIGESHLLLVEGPDDRGFFTSLASKLDLNNHIQIIELIGRNNLRPRLNAALMSSRNQNVELRSVGVVLDCEENPQSTDQMIRDAFKSAGLAVPRASLSGAGDNPQVAYMMLPDEQSPGMLEDLCLRAFTRDQAFMCIDEFFSCLDRREAFFSHSDASKAKVRAFLSSKDKAETRLGIAAQKSWWPWDDPVFDQVKQFLTLITAI